MNIQKWDIRYLELAYQVGTWSKDPSTKVGAILVRPNNSIASTGFNGFPIGHDDSPELYLDRVYKHKHVIHAEENALRFFEKRAENFSLYVSFPCCENCISLIISNGITRIVTPELPISGRSILWITEWSERIEKSKEKAKKNNIQWDTYDIIKK